MADNQSTPALHSAGAVRLICKWSMQSYFHNFVLPFGRLTGVGLPKELHPHHGEDEDDDHLHVIGDEFNTLHCTQYGL